MQSCSCGAGVTVGDGGGAPDGDAVMEPMACQVPADCNDGNECTRDWCNEGTCAHDPVMDGDLCDDGLSCTVNGRCVAGVCESTPLDCSALSDFCNVATCDEAAGGCVTTPEPDGSPCDDGTFCTEGDSCAAGACSGLARDCSAGATACAIGTCDETTASCTATPVADGTACDDGLYCTTGDACAAGACTASARDCSALDDACNLGTCDETLDACVATPANEGLGCSDGVNCTLGDGCFAGACAGTPVDCAGLGNTCNRAACDEAIGGCVLSPTNDGGACDDGRFCTIGDTCMAGTCTGPARNCDDGNACTTDVCDAGIDMCANTPVPPIPGAEGPPGDATCGDGRDNDCDALVDLADPNCVGCTGAAACNDGNPCTSDTCTGGVCRNAPISGGGCDDSLFCTVGDTCSAGTCVGSARDCSAASNACNMGTCSESLGACVATPANEGGACADALFCTVSESCVGGTCTGLGRDCSALGDACNTGVCSEPAASCVAQPVAGGTPCDRGFCFAGETCSAGVCSGGTAVTCSDGDACTADVCDAAASICRNPLRDVDPASPVSTSSDDGTPQTACVVAGSTNRVLVWADVRDTLGVPVRAATVAIGGVAATESAVRPGVYYREVTAPAAPGTSSLGVLVTFCGRMVMLSASASITAVAANATDGGTGGCSPTDGNVRVKVIAAETGAAIAGASVLFGMASGTPFEHAPEAIFGGAPSAASNVAVTDAMGFATFYDYGAALSGPLTVTAGAPSRAYFTVADGNASDLVLALPLLHPPVIPTTVYGNGTGASGGVAPWLPTGCNDLDAGIVLPKLQLDFFSGFDTSSLVQRNRCWDSMNGLVGTVAIPENVWIPAQSIGPFCLGGSVTAAPWSLTLKNTAATGDLENVELVLGSAPVTDVQNILSAGGSLADVLGILTYRRIGFFLNESVPTAPTSGRSIAVNETYPNNYTVTYAGRPFETDIIGVTAADYSGGNGTGPSFVIATEVHAWDVAGSTVTIQNSDLNAPGTPAGIQRFASISASYVTAAEHPTVPANRIDGRSTVLIRGTVGLPPFGAAGGTGTVTNFLDIAGTTFAAPSTFAWDNATLSGNSPSYSVHELVVRTRKHLPVLACQTTNQTVEEYSVQWIVVRPFSASCGTGECFTLPALPASFPRSASGVQQKSGFEQRVGSGNACAASGDCLVAGETCVDSDGGGAAGLRCMGGAGTAASPYTTQDYRWHLHLYDLELGPPFDFQNYRFADRILYMTHESSNREDFQ